jgi:hypothetical protein
MEPESHSNPNTKTSLIYFCRLEVHSQFACSTTAFDGVVGLALLIVSVGVSSRFACTHDVRPAASSNGSDTSILYVLE